jgi:hypothetical protein
MAGISALNPYGTYSPLFRTNSGGSTSSSTTSYTTQLRQLDVLFNNLKLLSSYSGSQAAARQSAYRAQVKEFATGAKNLATGADSLRSLADTDGTTKKMSVVSNFVDNFNSLTTTLRRADNLTTEGRGLFSSLKAAASVREDELKAIGIAYDSDSGELTVDEVKLKKAVETDYSKVQETLTGSSGLAASVDKTIGAAVREPVGEYLAAPSAKSADYTKLLGGLNATAYYSAYSQGLLLDLLA